MKILNFGSINIDYVYEVNHFVQPGETIASKGFQTFIGGKGCNQSVALAKAGVAVFHAGNISESGLFIQSQLEKWKVNTQFINVVSAATGHAIIQVNDDGENAIIIHGGANQTITSEQIENTLKHFETGDILLLQNEINNIPEIIEKAKNKGLKVFFNPAPMTENVHNFPLSLIDVFIINETEGEGLTGEKEIEKILATLQTKFPESATLLTLGKKGAIYLDKNERIEILAKKVKAIDTTAAGDTFIGYFTAGLEKGFSIKAALELATKAAAITVTRKGGSVSVPFLEEVF
jgi:ribokinase